MPKPKSDTKSKPETHKLIDAHSVSRVAPGEQGERGEESCLECTTEQCEASLAGGEAEACAADHCRRGDAAPERRVKQLKYDCDGEEAHAHLVV